MNPIIAFLLRLVERIALKTVPQGAATEVYVATNPALAGVSGKYFSHSNVAKPRRDADSAELAAKLWAVSEEIVAKL